jgi:hypothetical protein
MKSIREEMEAAIETTSGLVHNSQDWWDTSYGTNGKSQIEHLLDRLEFISKYSQQHLSAVIRQERGWAGHFIGAQRCQFRRNTLLTWGNVRVVVSTVGRWMNREGQYETIGPDDRWFETRAFHAKFERRYWDADVSREVFFQSPWVVSKFDADDIANEQHEAVVAEIAGWMESASRQVFIEEVCNAKND